MRRNARSGTGAPSLGPDAYIETVAGGPEPRYITAYWVEGDTTFELNVVSDVSAATLTAAAAQVAANS